MTSLANVAAQTLQRKIAEAEYRPGEKLPSQRELAANLGISRTSLREAISMLEALGMVRSHPGKGVFITKGTTRQPGEVPKGPASAQPDEVFQLRYIVEPAAASLAARNPKVDVAFLEDAQREMEAALDRLDLVMAAEWDMTFHRRLAEQSGNAALVEMLHQSESQIAYSLRLPFANAQRIWEPVDEHRQIIRAIADRDALAAQRAMQTHLLRAAARIGIRFVQP